MVSVISVEEHRAVVTALLSTSRPVRLPLADCSGLVLAEPVRAGVALPPFDNSAMDGYAVRAADVARASAEHGVDLPVAADIPAGRTDVPDLLPGTAHRIMTGAPMPPGADAIVMVEHTDGGTETVRIHSAVAAGSHLRRMGEDVAAGALALEPGAVLGPAQLGLAAAVGLDSLTVHAPPRVLVVSTGSELIVAPEPLRYGQIYESNSVMLVAAMREIGCHVEAISSVADDVDQFRAVIEPRLADVDLVVTSGGVSAGAYEVVKDALTDVGVRFLKVAMQPGGPQGCGHWNGVPVVTLPGNPVSVLVSFEAFLRPALRAAMGYAEVDRPHVRARLTEPLRSPAGRRQFRRGLYTPTHRDLPIAAVSAGPDGFVTGEVGPRGGPGSHLLAAFTKANCLIVLDETTTDVAESAEVDVLLLL